MPVIYVNNEEFKFEPNSLNGSLARKLVHAINNAYMRALSISCAPYTPTDSTARSWYICTCQLIHDNVMDYADCADVRNECLYSLRA